MTVCLCRCVASSCDVSPPPPRTPPPTGDTGAVPIGARAVRSRLDRRYRGLSRARRDRYHRVGHLSADRPEWSASLSRREVPRRSGLPQLFRAARAEAAVVSSRPEDAARSAAAAAADAGDAAADDGDSSDAAPLGGAAPVSGVPSADAAPADAAPIAGAPSGA